jgi:hypothetical protein
MAETVSIHHDLARRLREVRDELYGDGDTGLTAVSSALGLPAWTWSNFEAGVVIPGGLLLRFMAATGAHPHWLLTGRGDRYQEGGPRGPRP